VVAVPLDGVGGMIGLVQLNPNPTVSSSLVSNKRNKRRRENNKVI
jgi:hypothetical protein